MKADFHLHSSFSADSDAPMEEMIQQGILLGLDTLCFTEHMDYDYTDGGLTFEVDLPSYRQTFLTLKERYASRIELLFGIELGLQPCLKKRCDALTAEWPFDFVIGSSHLVNGLDPYDLSYFSGRTEKEAYGAYFQSVLDNVCLFSCMDVYGHLDYVVRYGPNKNRFYHYEEYRDLLEEILRRLIEKGIGLELNTGGFASGLHHPNPDESILMRYRELGGEIITVGSDAHTPPRIASDFDRAKQILKDCGFRYYTMFRGRKPVFEAL